MTLELADAASDEARWAMQQYFDELDRRFPDGFDPGAALDDAADRYNPPVGAFVLARRDGEVVGCGAVESLDEQTAEIKRMWVHPTTRGSGLGRRLVARLEDEARALGRTVVVLDTNSTLTEAIAMYASCGYEPTERYNDNPYADRWFLKALDREPA